MTSRTDASERPKKGVAMTTNDRELEFQLTEESWVRILDLANAVFNVLLLDEVREARKRTRTMLVDTLHLSRSEASEAECRMDLNESAIDSYIQDQDGLLEIWAVFPNGRIKINRLAGSACECHLNAGMPA